MERKERENNKGPLVYWYKPIPAMDERVILPFAGKVNTLDEFRAVRGPLKGKLDIVSRLLEHVLDGCPRRLEVEV